MGPAAFPCDRPLIVTGGVPTPQPTLHGRPPGRHRCDRSDATDGSRVRSFEGARVLL